MQGAQPDDHIATVEEYLDVLLAVQQPGFTGRDHLSALRGDAWASREAARRIIAAAQILRDTGAITPDSAFYLISLFAEDGTSAVVEVDPILVDLMERIREIEEAHGLNVDEGEAWHVDEGPPDWQALTAQFDRRFDALEAALLRECGEVGMATMFEVRKDEYDHRTEEGRLEYFQPRQDESEAEDADRGGFR